MRYPSELPFHRLDEEPKIDSEAPIEQVAQERPRVAEGNPGLESRALRMMVIGGKTHFESHDYSRISAGNVGSKVLGRVVGVPVCSICLPSNLT